jgi:hypothetical protein
MNYEFIFSILFSSFIIRAGVYGFSIGDSIACLAFLGYFSFLQFTKKQEHPDYSKIFEDRLREVDNKISAVLMKEGVKNSNLNSKVRF